MPALSRKARLLGTSDSALRSLLADVLLDEAVKLDDETKTPDLVLAVVTRASWEEVIAEAQLFRSPIVALLGYLDEPLARRVRDAGVERVHLLEAPLYQFRVLVQHTPRRRIPRR
jgi:hypothetical protein